MANLRTIPASEEHEVDVIGSLLWSGLRVDPDDVFQIVNSVDAFFSKKNQLVFGAILEVARVKFETISDTTVAAVLTAQGKFTEAGGYTYLVELKVATEESNTAISSAKVVRECYHRRLLIKAVEGYADAAYDRTEDITQTVGSLQNDLTKIGDEIVPDDVIHTSNISKEFFEHVNEYQTGAAEKYLVKTGLDNLDDIINGFKPGQMIVIAGPTGQGKTTLAMQIAYHNATRSKPVMINSLEMVPLEIYVRLVSAIAEVDSRDMERVGGLSPDATMRVTKADNYLQTLPIYFDRGIDKTNEGIYAQLKKQVQKKGIKLAVIDYIGLIRASRRVENKVQEVTLITREIKRMAIELQIPVIALAQISRARKGRTDSDLRLDDLRDSGSIEQDADMVMFIDEIKDEPKYSKITVKKNRSGACGSVEVLNERQFTRLKPLDRFHANLPEAEREFL